MAQDDGETWETRVARLSLSWRGAGRLAAVFTLAVVLLWAVRLLAHPLALLFAAIVLAEAMEPAVSWAERWLPRGLAAVLIYLLVAVLVGAIMWWVLPTLYAQAILVFGELPEMIDRARGWLRGRAPFVADQLADSVQSTALGLSAGLLSVPMLILSAAIEILLVIVLSIYWVVASPALHGFALSLVPPGRRAGAADTLRAMGETMGGFVRATLIDGLIVGVLTYLGMLVFDLPFPLVLALIAGLGELIPIIGPFLAAIPAVLLATLDGSVVQVLEVMVFFVVLQQVENHLLVPYVMKKQAGVPPLLAVFALFAGAYLGGALWALIAIPLAGATHVLAVRVVAPLGRRWLGATNSGGDKVGPGSATRRRGYFGRKWRAAQRPKV